MRNNILLKVKNLSTVFKTDNGVVHAVNGISFHLKKGEALGIVGESGCGKSVSVLSVMRLLQEPPAQIDAEELLFNNLDLLKASPEELRQIRGNQIAMVFQDPMTSLNPVLTIGFQMRESFQLHSKIKKQEAEKRSIELLELVGIPDPERRMEDFPHQLSGGMRQRVMIAMGLAGSPSLLIADEPTTALDVTIQAQIVELVKELQKKMRMTLIWISHDLGVIAGLADRVLVMYAGFIVEQAGVEELYSHPSHPYTKALLGSLPRMDKEDSGKLDAIDGLPPNLIQFPPGCPFYDRCDYRLQKCRQYRPELEEISAQHHIACWIDINTGDER